MNTNAKADTRVSDSLRCSI